MTDKKPPEDVESTKLVKEKKDETIQEDQDLCSRICSACCSACCDRCCRLLLAVLLLPFVIVLTLLALIVWLILLPRKYSTLLSEFTAPNSTSEIQIDYCD